MTTPEKNNEMTLILSIKRKPDGSFTGKIEGQGNNEKRAREELFSFESAEIIGIDEILKKLSQKVLNEALGNFMRIFGFQKSIKTNLDD